MQTYYRDDDGDGLGDENQSEEGCDSDSISNISLGLNQVLWMVLIVILSVQVLVIMNKFIQIIIHVQTRAQMIPENHLNVWITM